MQHNILGFKFQLKGRLTYGQRQTRRKQKLYSSFSIGSYDVTPNDKNQTSLKGRLTRSHAKRTSTPKSRQSGAGVTRGSKNTLVTTPSSRNHTLYDNNVQRS